MPQLEETKFNSCAAMIFIPEYEKETGEEISLLSCDQEFPDLIVERKTNGKHVGVELVEVILSFINQEQGELRHYEKRLTEAIIRFRPMFKDKHIRLQMSSAAATGPRPHYFPKINSSEAKALIAEFEKLLYHHGPTILASWGGQLRQLNTTPNAQQLPILELHFDAIILNSIPETYPGRSHPDDPVIDLCSVTMHNESEIDNAVQRAIGAKLNKGPSYTTDLLVLHTLRASHKPYVEGIRLQDRNIVQSGTTLAPRVRERFREVWFLSGSLQTNGKRLHRLL